MEKMIISCTVAVPSKMLHQRVCYNHDNKSGKLHSSTSADRLSTNSLCVNVAFTLLHSFTLRFLRL